MSQVQLGPRGPKVSVVVPSRDRLALVGTTAASLLAQRGVDLEVLVVDDGSTDGTAEALRSLGDRRLRVLRNERSQGVAHARNRGIAEARGEWIAFCDDDDLWAPDKLARQVAAAEERGRSWAVGGALSFTATGTGVLIVGVPTDEEVVALLPHVNAVPGGCSNVVAHRDLLARIGGFDPAFRVLADWELWIRMARVGPPATVEEPLVAYRLHAANMSSSSRGVLQEYDALLRLTADLRGGSLTQNRHFHLWMGRSAWRGGARRGAVAGFARAARWGDRRSLGRMTAALLAPRPAWELAKHTPWFRAVELPVPAWLQVQLDPAQRAPATRVSA